MDPSFCHGQILTGDCIHFFGFFYHCFLYLFVYVRTCRCIHTVVAFNVSLPLEEEEEIYRNKENMKDLWGNKPGQVWSIWASRLWR